MRLHWLSGVLVLGVVIACGEGAGLEGENSNITPGLTGGGATGAGATTGAGAITGGGGTTGTPVVVGTMGGGTTGVTSPGGAGGAGNGLPCEVDKILKEKCQTCHGSPLMSGPMALITNADLQAASTAKPGQTIAQRVKARIADTNLPMPPTGRTPLSAADKAALNAYIDSGAKASTVACQPVVATTGGTAGGAAGGTTGGTGIGGYIPKDSECDYLQELRAHGGQTPGDTAPFEPPQGTDHYEIFYFKPMWTEKVHTIRLDPIIDNGAVLHHWLLYMEPTGGGDGTHKSDVGLQSASSALLSGWAPGNQSIPLGTDIGLLTIAGPNSRFGIELHYNTTSNPANRKDRSGARICATKKLRPKEASVHWLGTQAIVSLGLGGKFDAGGGCTVKKESHIIAHSPHMHTQGRYMKTIVTKKGGEKVKITDQAFEFLDQQIFPVDSPTGEIVVAPGDTIQTTCTFDGSKVFSFGPNTDQEMCYNFVVAWPAGSLSNGSAGIVGGQNTCIDGI
jgi:hypothetical protein